MQNIESILKEFGLEIPAEQAAAFQAKFRDNYKTVREVEKIESARKDYEQKLAARDFDDALKTALEEIKFTSEAAKRDVAGQVRAAGLKLADGKIAGLDELIGQIREKDAGAFVDERQEALEAGRARFTQPTGDGGRGGEPMTREKIMAMPDRAARRQAIAENIKLF